MTNATKHAAPKSIFSTREIADLLGTDCWRIQRLFENGDLPDTQRFAGKRMIPGAMIPRIVDALRTRGWLPVPAEAAR